MIGYRAGSARLTACLATLLAGLIVTLAAATGTAKAGEVGSTFTPTKVGGDYIEPLFVAAAPDSPRLLFVVERRGVVRVIRDGEALNRPFLDISDIVRQARPEQGLFSIAFDPDYRHTGLFYVYFTNRDCDEGTDGCDVELAEFRRRRGDRSRALRQSYRQVITIPHDEHWAHNGGTAMFGPDGRLWIATGDGGNPNDPEGSAFDTSLLLGKLLRIDPHRHRGENGRIRSYRIPRHNPFVGVPGRDAIWALGLRNPFRFSFDWGRRAIVIGDVGQATIEEINYLSLADARGANFGWPEWEGNLHVDPSRPGPGTPVEPIYVYDHSAGKAAVIGGIVVRDPRFAGTAFDPALGRYLFQDGYIGPPRSFIPDLETGGIENYLEATGFPYLYPGGFGEDAEGRVYYVARIEGHIYRLDPSL